MSLQPIHNRSLADQVFEQLTSEILQGHYVPGALLPAERSLVGVFGVNRHVVREALKRLEQMGLVKVSQGGGTKVLDFKRHAGLDLLALMAEGAHGGEDALEYWLAVLQMRAAIGTDAARLCALRGSAEIKAELTSVAHEMSQAPDSSLFLLEIRFWDRVLEGAANIAYRLAFNTMLRGSYAVPEMSQQWSANECKASGHRLMLATAIAAGDAVVAESRARTDMRAAVDALAQVIEARKAPAARATLRGRRESRRPQLDDRAEPALRKTRG